MKPKTSKCRACGEAIYWAHTLKVTAAGVEVIGEKAWPVDELPSEKGNVSLVMRGERILARVSAAPVPGGRMAHHATCEAWPKGKE